jgi:hypothetical protein
MAVIGKASPKCCRVRNSANLWSYRLQCLPARKFARKFERLESCCGGLRRVRIMWAGDFNSTLYKKKE